VRGVFVSEFLGQAAAERAEETLVGRPAAEVDIEHAEVGLDRPSVVVESREVVYEQMR
jgi:hypothetical protein